MCIMVDNMEANQSTKHKGSLPMDQREMEFIEFILRSRCLKMLVENFDLLVMWDKKKSCLNHVIT